MLSAADASKEYAGVSHVEIGTEYAESYESYHRKWQTEPVYLVNVHRLYELVDQRESKQLNSYKDTEENGGASLGCSYVFCKHSNARGEDVHAESLTKIHTHQLSEGLVFQRLDDLGNVIKEGNENDCSRLDFF